MTNAAREQLMRDTVLLEMMKTLPPEKSAFKLDIGTGENGIVVCSPDEDTCEVFDVKLKLGDPRRRSSVLMNPEMMAAVERKYGKINRCCVLTARRIGLKEAQYIMGHADSAMTMEVYTHLDATKRNSAAKILAKYRDELGNI